MTITISDGKISHDYYEVPNKVAKAIITLLNECGNTETEIVTAESEIDYGRTNNISDLPNASWVFDRKK